VVSINVVVALSSQASNVAFHTDDITLDTQVPNDQIYKARILPNESVEVIFVVH